MFQITEFHSKGRKIDTEWGKMTFLEWLKCEQKRIGGWTEIVEKIDKYHSLVALFYKKDRRQS